MVDRIPFEQLKPIGNPAFRDLTDSLLSGYKAGAYPAEQKQKYRASEENILKTALANEFEKKYGNQKRAADIANTLAQTGLYGAQTSHYGAQTHNLLHPKESLSEYEKALLAREHIKAKYPEGSKEREQIEQIVANLAIPKAQSNGISVTLDEKGQPMVQIGGPAGKSGGSTFVNDKGEITSSLTTPATTKAQNAVLAENRLKPFIESLTQNLPQFQSKWSKFGNEAAGFANNWFGANFAGPSQEQEGKADITIAAEGLINSFGLNGSKAAIKSMESTLEPAAGESPAQYKQRVERQIANIVESQKGTQFALAHGLKVGNNKQKNNAKEKKVIVNGKEYIDIDGELYEE